MLNTLAKFCTIFSVLDIPPFLPILSHMIDFLCRYKFILCIITFCINESTACVNLTCKAIFEFPPLDCACTKMSKTLQSYKTYSIFYTICSKPVLNKNCLCAKT